MKYILPIAMVMLLSACRNEQGTPQTPDAPLSQTTPQTQQPPAPPLAAVEPAPVPPSATEPAPSPQGQSSGSSQPSGTSGESSESSDFPGTSASSDRPQEYTVAEGDTLSTIAQQHGLNYQDVASWNNLQNPDLILPGQTLRLTAP